MTKGSTMTESDGELKRLHPWSLLYRLVVSLPALVLVLLPAIRSADANAWLSLTMLLLYGLFVVPLILLQYLRFRYAVTPREVIIRRGVLTRQDRSIPIERIQNIEIEQPLLPRALGMAKVKIETAGSAVTEGVIEYVSLAEAQAIRAKVKSYQRRTAAATEGPAIPSTGAVIDSVTVGPAPEAVEELLHRMPLSRVLLSGVFRFSLLYIVVIFSATEYVGLEPDDIARWFAGDRFNAMAAAMEGSPWLIVVTTGAMVLILAWITGILINLNRFYGFRLTREGDKLHVRHGLLTVSDGTIPLKKVQALMIRTNLLMSAFGWYRLELQTVGFDSGERGYRVAAPFAELEEIERLGAAIRSYTAPSQLERVSRLMIRRTFIRYSATLLLLAAAVSFFWIYALWAIALLPILYFLALQQYRQHGFAEDGEYLFVRRGFFRRNFWIIPLERSQVFYLTHTLFQRRLGLRSVFVDTPGAGMLTPAVVVDLPKEAASTLLDQLYNRFMDHFSRPASHDSYSSLHP